MSIYKNWLCLPVQISACCPVPLPHTHNAFTMPEATTTKGGWLMESQQHIQGGDIFLTLQVVRPGHNAVKQEDHNCQNPGMYVLWSGKATPLELFNKHSQHMRGGKHSQHTLSDTAATPQSICQQGKRVQKLALRACGLEHAAGTNGQETSGSSLLPSDSETSLKKQVE